MPWPRAKGLKGSKAVFVGSGFSRICCGMTDMTSKTPRRIAQFAAPLLLGIAVWSALPAAAQTGTPAITREQVDKWMSELSNWGRWGKTDGIGTLNLITPA